MSLKNAGVGWNGGHTLGYYTYIMLEEPGFQKAVVFTYCTLIGCNSTLSETNEGEAFDNVVDEAKQDCTNSSSDSDSVYPPYISSNVVTKHDITSSWMIL